MKNLFISFLICTQLIGINCILVQASPTYNIPLSARVLYADTHASIPAGWTRDTDFDDYFIKGGTDTFTTPLTGGATEHDHSATAHFHTLPDHEHEFGAGAAAGASTLVVLGGGTRRPSETHTHSDVFSDFASPASPDSDPTSGTFETDSNDWIAVSMIAIKPDHGALDMPTSSFCFTNNTSLPVGFTKITGQFWEGSHVKISTTGADGGIRSGVSRTHNHTFIHDHTNTDTHLHNVKRAGGVDAGTDLAAGGVRRTRTSTHHEVTGASGTGGTIFDGTGRATIKEIVLPFFELLGVVNTSGSARTSTGIIIPYTDTVASIPEGWVYCDGNNGTPDLREVFPTMSANDGDIGLTGGTTEHDHPGTQTHLHPSATHDHNANPVTLDQETGVPTFGGSVTALAWNVGVDTDTHTHTWTFSNETPAPSASGIGSGTGSHIPSNRTVIFIKKVNVSRNIPYLFGSIGGIKFEDEEVV